MKKPVCNYSQYTFVEQPTGIDYSELITVPDQVLSMYDIYMKYAVRGEISGLANNIRPHVTDDLDYFDEAVDFVPEEDLDVLQRSHTLRMAADAKASVPADPAVEDISVAEGVDKDPEDPAKQDNTEHPDAGS